MRPSGDSRDPGSRFRTGTSSLRGPPPSIGTSQSSTLLTLGATNLPTMTALLSGSHSTAFFFAFALREWRSRAAGAAAPIAARPYSEPDPLS